MVALLARRDASPHLAIRAGDDLTYSRFANIICGMIKGQDIVVLAALMDKKVQKLSYAGLSDVVCLSVAETHAAVKRLQEATLLNGERSPVRRNVSEFLVHGVRYAFPMRASGRLAKGMPTAYAAPVAADEFATSGMVPVWTGSRGDVQGQAFDPLYPTAPEAAAGNETLYGRLALIDMLRGGRIRERRFAEKKIGEML